MTFITVESAFGARPGSTLSTNRPPCSSNGTVRGGQQPTGNSTSSIHQLCTEATGSDSFNGTRLLPWGATAAGASEVIVYAPVPAVRVKPFHISAPGAVPQ